MSWVDSNWFDEVLRLLVASGVGVVIGINREMHGKPLGMRTLALVGLGSAIAALTAIDFRGIDHEPQALSRVVQGVLQGVLTGIGFIGAGVVLRDAKSGVVQGLTTAATVWVTAALGIASALAAWHLVLSGVIITLIILFGLGWVEGKIFPDNDDSSEPRRNNPTSVDESKRSGD
ncbi:MAG: MgtC/SapB family protein [Pseudolabrys sp.]|nr:MgtC/SapB family protein [Pseudolabrys sp.]